MYSQERKLFYTWGAGNRHKHWGSWHPGFSPQHYRYEEGTMRTDTGTGLALRYRGTVSRDTWMNVHTVLWDRQAAKPVARITVNSRVLVFKYHSPLKGPQFFKEMATAGQGVTNDSLGQLVPQSKQAPVAYRYVSQDTLKKCLPVKLEIFQATQ